MNNNRDNELLAWAGRKIKKAQDDKIYGQVVINIKDGEIFKVDINQSHVPPSAGALYKDTGG